MTEAEERRYYRREAWKHFIAVIVGYSYLIVTILTTVSFFFANSAFYLWRLGGSVCLVGMTVYFAYICFRDADDEAIPMVQRRAVYRLGWLSVLLTGGWIVTAACAFFY